MSNTNVDLELRLYFLVPGIENNIPNSLHSLESLFEAPSLS